MDTGEAIANGIRQLCKDQGIAPNAIGNISAVPQATVKSILKREGKNPGAVMLKKLCDGFEITLDDYFFSPEDDALEQEIKRLDSTAYWVLPNSSYKDFIRVPFVASIIVTY